MPVFRDSDNRTFELLPEGDYVFCVVNFEAKISQGAKTRGCEAFEMELEMEPSGARVIETLIDHDKTAWKIDTFLKSAGIKLAKGEAFEFREDLARANGVRWVNPMGLRGWCRLIQDTLPPRADRPGEKPLVVNKIATFYTDKPKLAPRAAAEPAEEDRPF